MIYLDNAATTKMDSICLESFEKFGIENFYNPSALYAPSVENSRAILKAREGLLSILHAGGGELYFTASGTEADNLALFGTKKRKGSKVIISASEHAAVYNSALELSNQGFEVIFAPINNDGSLNLEQFSSLLDDNVSLVSVMHVNNETGAINDLEQISKLIRKYAKNAIFHSDGVQGFCKTLVNLKAYDVDLYSLSAHKIHAPKGIGALYVKKGIHLSPIIFGGGQEKGIRSATENVPAIDAFYKVAKKQTEQFAKNFEYKKSLLLHMRKEIEKKLPSAQIISPITSPHILMLALYGVRGEVVLHSLEKFEIYIGIGSACSSKKGINRSKTLLGLDKKHEEGVIRISVSEENTIEEIDTFIEKLVEVNAELIKYTRV